MALAALRPFLPRRRRPWARDGMEPVLLEEVLRKVRQVEIKARILADEGFLGAYRSVFRGSGLEFEEVREYQAGDDVRSIDWNVTARMGTPYVKKYREERELNIVLAIDVSASSWFGTASVSKRELAADVAALLAIAALRTNDRTALLLFSDRVHDFVRPRRGRDHVLRLVGRLIAAEPRRSSTDIEAAARFLRNVMKKRSVVFVLSDFLDTTFEAALRMLGRKHDVIALVLADPREQELPDVGVIALEDAESGSLAYVDTGEPRVREDYARDAAQRRAERVRAFTRMGIDYVELSTDGPYVPPLLALFDSRVRRV